MSLACVFGFHDWNGCKCSKCGKIRDEGHDWSKDCEKCALCNKVTAHAHVWKGCKCTKCGRTRDDGHDFLNTALTCSRCGVSADVTANKDGFTLLHKAACEGRKDIAQLLIAKGADVNAVDNAGFTPFRWAVCGGHKTIVELLIKGADVNEVHTSGNIPLTEAEEGYTQIAKRFKAAMANAVYAHIFGLTPLHLASAIGKKEIAELLIANGANVNAVDKLLGTTPLLWALLKYDLTDIGELNALAKLLIAKGTDVNTVDKNGRTALSVAKEKGFNEIVDLISANLANISASQHEDIAALPLRLCCTKCNSRYSVGEDAIIVTMDMTKALIDGAIILQSANPSEHIEKDLVSLASGVPAERRSAVLMQASETARSVLTSLKNGQNRVWICYQCKNPNNYP
jgi:hypothetical protein